MYSTVPAALLAAFLSTVAVRPAGAADVSAAQAEALQSQMQSWLRGVLGPDSSPTGPAVQVRPEGDHYRIELPLGTPRAGQPSPVTLFTSARPAEDGRWLFEGTELLSPARFKLNMPVPARNGNAPAASVPVEYTVTTGHQDSRGTYDPSFATPSTFMSNFKDVQIRAQGALLDQLTKIERSSGTSTLRPSGSNRVDLVGGATIEGYTLTSRSQDGPHVELSAQQMRATTELTGLSRDRAATMLPAIARTVGGLITGIPTPGSNAPAIRPPVDPQLLRTILQSLQGLASEFTLDEMFDGIALRSGTRGGAASQFRIGVGAKSDGGLLQASMDLNLDGFVVPDPALGAMADLLPRKVALRYVLTGVPTEELIQWLAATAEAKDGTRPPGFFATLFRRTGVSAGWESFALDIGGTSFVGMDKLTVVSPGNLIGQAQVTAANFEDLIARATAVPELAGVLPAFIFAKGIGRTVEGRLAWDIAYSENKVLVNGIDLVAMVANRPPTRGTPSH